jgi:plasminogen activator inhibitor 1 RNA-binding protein
LKAEEAATNDAAAEGAATTDWAPDATPAGEWGAPDSTATDAWGTPDAAASADSWNVPVADTTAPLPEGDKPEGRPRRERELEEEDNTLTLEQYLAQQKDKESIVPKLEGTRKANEGADANIWKDVVPLQKEDDDAYFVGKVGIRNFPLSFIHLSYADQGRAESSS